MPTTNDIRWFKENFQAGILTALESTPYTVDMLTAIACQETGYIWQTLRKHLPVAQVLELCVGDSLDYNPSNPSKSRAKSAFPNNRAKLEAVTNGNKMFAIARKALVDMSEYIGGYAGAVANPNKFCHGFGIFQYDIQEFLNDPNYFLNKRWGDFSECLKVCLQELDSKLKKIGYGAKTSLTDLEQCHVAIAYNKGSYNPALGLKQGYKSGGKYYGEKVFEYLQLSKTVTVAGGAPPTPPPTPPPGEAPLPEPTPVAATGTVYEVDVRIDSSLMLRATPNVANGKPTGAVLRKLVDGTLVQAVDAKKVNGFLEVETSIHGGFQRGWAFAKYLQAVAGVPTVPIEAPAAAPPVTGVVAVFAPYAPGQKVKRINPAGACSLNEAGMPSRNGTTPAELCEDIADIIAYLAVDDSSHKRFKPGAGKTYCNIYAHDFCHLAGVYLPRVWWSQASIQKLTQGQTVIPKVGTTVDEVRANDLFRWLRDWGTTFGWRQTGTLTKLQAAANQGAVGIIVARRTNDGKSGHIVAVVPETASHEAKRNSAGDVTQALESQAGETNYRYVTKSSPWWLGSQFAEHAFWIHA